MKLWNRYLIAFPSLCLAAGLLSITGLEGCASRRHSRNPEPADSGYSQPSAGTAGSSIELGQPAPPAAPPAQSAPPVPNEIGQPDSGPNFLHDAHPQDAGVPAPAPAPESDKSGATRPRRGQKLAGFLPRWATPSHRIGKKGRRQADRTEPQTNGSAAGSNDESAPTRVRPGDKIAWNSNLLKAKQASHKPQLDQSRGQQAVKLGTPPEIYQYSTATKNAESFDWRLDMRNSSASHQATRQPLPRSTYQAPAARPISSSGEQDFVTRYAPLAQHADDDFAPLPDWNRSNESRHVPLIRSQPLPYQMPQIQSARERAEPGPLPSSPELRQLPSRQAAGASSGLSISRIALCRDVRGFDDFTEIDASSLKQGQQFLIYAALENFRSVSTINGFQTLTLSSLEVWTRSGQQVARQPLGTAADLADAPRRQYFLTHAVKVPEHLADGDYLLQLNVYDLNGRVSSQKLAAVRVRGGITADRTRPDATDGSAGLAAAPASFRR